MSDDVIDRALEGVSDGAPVDWAALEEDAANEFDLDCLRWLRLLGQIAAVHRTMPDDLQASPTTTDEPTRAEEEVRLHVS